MSAETKLELLGLIDGAVRDGWAHTRACRVLGLADVRAHRWRARLRETGSLEDGRPVGEAVHRLLSWEEQAILELLEEWGWVDRSHRKLAHRGSYTGTVFVSPSTLLRVALTHRVELPGEPVRPRPSARPSPARRPSRAAPIARVDWTMFATTVTASPKPSPISHSSARRLSNSKLICEISASSVSLH